MKLLTEHQVNILTLAGVKPLYTSGKVYTKTLLKQEIVPLKQDYIYHNKNGTYALYIESQIKDYIDL